MEHEIPLRITVVNPLSGVVYMMQRGRDELVPPDHKSETEISFDFTVRAKIAGADEVPNFLGKFVQGPRGDRFVYVNSGKHAGQMHTLWDRRAKIKLQSISWKLIDEVLDIPDAVLEARFNGVGRDGGPACATVPLVDGGWRIIEAN
jgi:hypothetical protein